MGKDWDSGSTHPDHGVSDRLQALVASGELKPDPAQKAMAARFDRLLRETRPEALFAYICERGPEHGPSVLYLEIVSADASYAAEYPICAGEGWHVRDLLKAAHRKLDPVTLD